MGAKSIIINVKDIKPGTTFAQLFNSDNNWWSRTADSADNKAEIAALKEANKAINPSFDFNFYNKIAKAMPGDNARLVLPLSTEDGTRLLQEEDLRGLFIPDSPSAKIVEQAVKDRATAQHEHEQTFARALVAAATPVTEAPAAGQPTAQSVPGSATEPAPETPKAEAPAAGQPAAQSTPEPATEAPKAEGAAAGQPAAQSTPEPAPEPATATPKAEAPAAGQPAAQSVPGSATEPAPEKTQESPSARAELVSKADALIAQFKAAKGANSFVGKRGLKSGKETQLIQTLLLEAGYPLPKRGLDGRYGAEMEGAIRQAQKDAHITYDGDAGVEVLAALKARILTKEISGQEVMGGATHASAEPVSPLPSPLPKLVLLARAPG